MESELKMNQLTVAETLDSVDVNNRRFWRRYLYHAIHYMPFFFREAPIIKWHTFLASAHRVSWDCARGDYAIEAEIDIWNKGALRGRFLRWADNYKLNN